MRSRFAPAPKPFPLLGPGAETLRALARFSTDQLRAAAEGRGLAVTAKMKKTELAHALVRESIRAQAEAAYVAGEDAFPAKDSSYPALVKLVARGKFKRIFDAGCGPGLFAHQLQPHLPRDASYVGVDLIRGAIELGRARLAGDARFELARGDLDTCELPSGVDCVVMLYTLNYLDTHRADAVLERMARAWPGATLICAVVLRACVDRLHDDVPEDYAAEQAALLAYLRGQRAAARRIWDMRRFDCYAHSVRDHFALEDEIVRERARQVIWRGRAA